MSGGYDTEQQRHDAKTMNELMNHTLVVDITIDLHHVDITVVDSQLIIQRIRDGDEIYVDTISLTYHRSNGGIWAFKSIICQGPRRVDGKRARGYRLKAQHHDPRAAPWLPAVIAVYWPN